MLLFYHVEQLEPLLVTLISIHQMLLFYLRKLSITSSEHDFNTSNVTILQDFLKLLRYYSGFQYIKCYYSTNWWAVKTAKADFNTSNVTILQTDELLKLQSIWFQYIKCYYSTVSSTLPLAPVAAFQYIKCYYSTLLSFLRFYSVIISIHQMLLFYNMTPCSAYWLRVFQYIKCYYSTVWKLFFIHHSTWFQYIKCYYSTFKSHLLFPLLFHFNTSNVTILQGGRVFNRFPKRYFNTSNVTILPGASDKGNEETTISIHQMLLFYPPRASLS